LKNHFSSEELLTRVSDCPTDKFVVAPSSNGKTGHAFLSGFERLVGESPAMQSIKPYISQVAVTDSTVLITGESGTGKELVAELIHRNSPRNGRPLVCVNCAALPDSLLESELFGYERGLLPAPQLLKEESSNWLRAAQYCWMR
jgi:transcriptional regulator with GAF, ATPase, and Fis domain